MGWPGSDGRMTAVATGRWWIGACALMAWTMGAGAAGLSPHFKGRFGSVEIYDAQAKLSFRVNPPRLTQPLPVCAAANLAIVVAALKHGTLKPEASERSWDATRFPAAADWPARWQQAQTLDSALRYGTPWYFEQLKSEVGTAGIQQQFRLQKLKYVGDQAVAWRGSVLDQVEWLKALRSNSTGLPAASQAALLKSLERGKLEGRTLYGVGARCAQDDGWWLGWQIGWVEKPGGPVFYALNAEGKDRADLAGEARRITRGALAEMKFFPLDPAAVPLPAVDPAIGQLATAPAAAPAPAATAAGADAAVLPATVGDAPAAARAGALTPEQ